MEKVEGYKKTLVGAIACTCSTVIFLINVIMIRSKNGGGDVFSLVSIIAMTIVSSLLWVCFLKQYVDFAIEEKLKDRKIVEIAIQEKIKKLEEKE